MVLPVILPAAAKTKTLLRLLMIIALPVPTVSILIASSLSASLILPCCFLTLLCFSDAELVLMPPLFSVNFTVSGSSVILWTVQISLYPPIHPR